MKHEPYPIDTSILSEHDPVSLPLSNYEDTNVVAGAEDILRRSFEPAWRQQAKNIGAIFLQYSVYGLASLGGMYSGIDLAMNKHEPQTEEA